MSGRRNTPPPVRIPDGRRETPPSAPRRTVRDRLGSLTITVIGIAMVAATIAATIALPSPTPPAAWGPRPGRGAPAKAAPIRVRLPAKPGSYLGVYERGVPHSYAPVEAFAHAIGRQPNVVLYFSKWDD